jgi:hypothetical protein
VVRGDGSFSIGPAVWFSDFADVPQADPFHDFVERIFRRGITAGCTGGNYCRDAAVTRAQMAVFLLKARHNRFYRPPACQGIFSDVPCPANPQFPYSDWIEQLLAEGITAGCDVGRYCPDQSVTRAQMAVFLLKAEHGQAYLVPACTGVFADVVCPTTPQFPYSDWIERLYAEGVTGGCGTNPPRYCPDDPVTRGQMAVFLTKAFYLP